MKTVISQSQYRDDQIACIVDSLIFGHLQRKQYSKTLNALLSESPHLLKDATTMPNAPNQIYLNVNSFLHDQNLEQIIQSFYTYGRLDLPPKILDLGKRLRDLANEFSTELAFGCHTYSNNEQRLYGRRLRMRTQQNPSTNQMYFNNQHDVNNKTEYMIEQVPQSVNESPYHNESELQYSHAVESHETRAEGSSSHDNAQHSRRKPAQPLKQSQKQTQRVMQYVEDLAKISTDNLRDKDAGLDNSSFMIDPFLEDPHFNEIIQSVVDGEETLFGAFETMEREEAMEADQNSRDSMNQFGTGSLALDVPMHEDLHQSNPSIISPFPRQPPSISSHPHSIFSIPPLQPQSQHNVSNHLERSRPLTEQYTHQPSMSNPMESREHNASLPPSMPPPPPPHPSNSSIVDVHSKMKEPEKKSSRVGDARDSSWTKNGSCSSLPKTRLPPSAPSLPPSTSNSLGTTLKLSSLGRIPKKVQSIQSPQSINRSIPAPSPSPSASPKTTSAVPVVESKVSDVFRMSRGKIAPLVNGNDGRRDSMDSQDTLRGESVGESDCTMTENEDNDQPLKRERTKSEREKKANWDDLFEDSPTTMEESNKEKDKMKELQETKRRLEMKEFEKKKEREKRRKDKEKTEEDKREGRSKDDKNRHDKRFGDDRRRDSLGRGEKMEREREKEREREREREREIDKERKSEKYRREQEEQKRVIQATKENEDKARQKMKDEEERKKALKEKEDEKRREIKKIEDEKLRKEKEIKAKEEKRNELERRRRKELQLKKAMPPVVFGDSPLDKIAAVMDGKELRKENEYETTTRASSRVMEISSGVARNRSFSQQGSLHSSKSGIYLDKAQKLRDTTEKPPPEARRPIRPIRVQMAPMKRPPTAMATDDESDEEEGERRERGERGERRESHPIQKRGKIEDNKINSILNKLHQ